MIELMFKVRSAVFRDRSGAAVSAVLLSLLSLGGTLAVFASAAA